MKPSLPNRAIEWNQDHLLLLDQRLLPGEVDFIRCDRCVQVQQAITDMVVRGAPAIGISAAYAVALSVREHISDHKENWRQSVQSDLDQLRKARPTAVNLAWAIDRMEQLLVDVESKDAFQKVLQLAHDIHRQDIEANQKMGALGAAYIEPGTQVMTHCNAGALATGGYGTALGVIRAAHAAGKIDSVFANETRPWFQGSRLTAWELAQDHIPVQVICDSAAATVLRSGTVSSIVVGADRVAANGDVANKIGTYNLAVNARHHGVRFMVAAPISTIDPATASGDLIPIEERAGSEIVAYKGLSIGVDSVPIFNPVFDITPAELIDVLITEKGVIEQPNAEKIARLLKES